MRQIWCTFLWDISRLVDDDLLFCHTTGEAICNSFDDLIAQNNLEWKRCVGIFTGGAAAMTGKQKGPGVRSSTICCSYTLLLSQGTAGCEKICHIAKNQFWTSLWKSPTRSKVKRWMLVLLKLCVKKWEVNTRNSFLTLMSAGCHVGKFSPVFSNCEKRYCCSCTLVMNCTTEVMISTKLADLADIFNNLKNLNEVLQGKTVTIFYVQDKIKATCLKWEMWFKQISSMLSSREVDSFVDFAADWMLKTTFREESLTGFWLHIQPEHLELASSALKPLM